MIRYLIFLIFALMPLARAAVGAEWRMLPGQEKPSHWLLAFEEAEFIRPKIGDWLVIGIFRTDANTPLRWKLDYIHRKDNQCELSMSLVSGKIRRQLMQKYSWFDKGPDAELIGELVTEEKEIQITIPQGDGSKRRVWLRRADGLGELRETVKISKAMLVWKWENVSPVDL